MASEGSGAMKTSKLAQMQMRFQQRTHQEQEARRRELAATKSNGDVLNMAGNGKVRQMFDERRRGAGIDRSNPLRPIGTLPSPPAASLAKTRPQHPVERLTKGVSAMTLKEAAASTNKRITSDSNNNKFATPRTVNRNLKPVITRKTPPAQEAQRSPGMQPSTRLVGAGTSATNRRSPPPPRQWTTERSHQFEPKSPVKKVTKMEPQAPPPEGTAQCKHCGRHFLTDRLQKHETVCARMMSTKRKIFDASKQRIIGTDAEKFNKKGKGGLRSQTSYSSAAQQKGLTTGVKKNNWRKKHEEFIQSIRAAKQVQQHLARGGKLSDLPPPPPSENPDYIQCPHCSRRFNQQAAERHIPKCATMVHNKPRNGPPPKKR
ncbi:zinc finger C2HC domain-containing protein 1C [Drosophila serrata]|uniref:zinc finger C2HC domain-containing protein 1C n=1 Tax=Drosophila serrata TaxID=7274 RepID=UPI000A1D30C9|nr:zinc finger C2HC domain-containing protein 1C [Drosophila serrata]XP_020817282.1 zinc finger C2HC domain-containing protein 1C [Drosophila serrata]XP_020817283.1 zinc finger C2HC domain-containing protein 1C [Drosophila serrata]XP_020817284.1 zinc finger C2HC domain-containing protein 1C [Drosophila serrata]